MACYWSPGLNNELLIFSWAFTAFIIIVSEWFANINLPYSSPARKSGIILVQMGNWGTSKLKSEGYHVVGCWIWDAKRTHFSELCKSKLSALGHRSDSPHTQLRAHSFPSPICRSSWEPSSARVHLRWSFSSSYLVSLLESSRLPHSLQRDTVP